MEEWKVLSVTTAILSRICKTALASCTRHVLHFVIPLCDYNIFFLESGWSHWIIPPSHHSNDCQQDVFQAQNRWWHREPGVLRERGALFGYPSTGPHCGMQSITVFSSSFSYSNQIDNCLNEWQTGEHVDVQFSAAAYKNKFIAHLKWLEDFAEKTKDVNIVSCLRKHLLKMAKYILFPFWFW